MVSRCLPQGDFMETPSPTYTCIYIHTLHIICAGTIVLAMGQLMLLLLMILAAINLIQIFVHLTRIFVLPIPLFIHLSRTIFTEFYYSADASGVRFHNNRNGNDVDAW